MITCHRKYLEQRCIERGQHISAAMPCVVAMEGDMWTVNVDHPSYPRLDFKALSFKCVPDCTTSQFACETGFCCEENISDGGLMSQSDTCYQTYTCDSNSRCVSQGYATTGDDETACLSKCQTVSWRCDGYGGCTPVYGTAGTPLEPGQYSMEVDCNNVCLIRYECYPWSGCQSIGYSNDLNQPSDCSQIDCAIRYDCNPTSGCQQIGYGTTGLKVCDDTVCVPSYNCNPSSGCVAVYDGTGQFSGTTGKEALNACEASCVERFECKNTGCQTVGYGTTGLIQADCVSSCDVKCVSESFFVSGVPSGNCGKVPYGTRTITVPSGVSLPVQVTISGTADDDFLVDGQAVPKNTPFGGCNGAGPFPDYTFTLNQTTFTIAAGDNHGGNTSYDVTICFD